MALTFCLTIVLPILRNIVASILTAVCNIWTRFFYPLNRAFQIVSIGAISPKLSKMDLKILCSERPIYQLEQGCSHCKGVAELQKLLQPYSQYETFIPVVEHCRHGK